MSKWTQPYLGGARHDENGKYVKGKAGDQTGKEVAISKWYALPAKWGYVIRAKDRAKRNEMGDIMMMICANDNIGYDQTQRGTLHTQLVKHKYDVTKVDKCETDCSATVSAVLYMAGYKKIPYNCTTSTLLANINKYYPNEFEIFTDRQHTQSNKYCRKGDIYLSKGHHVEIVVKGGVYYTPKGIVK